MDETAAIERDDERWAISVPEVGRRLGISRAHAYRLVASGGLPGIRLGHRTVVPLEALRALLSAAPGGTECTDGDGQRRAGLPVHPDDRQRHSIARRDREESAAGGMERG